jgi:N-acetylmuramoyl-L-alanine amidase
MPRASNLKVIYFLSLMIAGAFLFSCFFSASPALAFGPLPPRSADTIEISPPPGNKELDPYLPIICIDPGHGGIDLGAVGANSELEKDLTLQIALKLKKIIEKNLDSEIILTRYYDEFIPLDLRASIANHNRAAVFVSIHVNSHMDKKAAGIETFFLSTLPTDKEAERVAAFENSVIRFESGGKEKYEDLQRILIDMFETEIQHESAMLAEHIQLELSKKINTRNRGVRQAPFYVLAGTQMPAVMVEVGFISNSKEAGKLCTAVHQEKIAKSIFNSLLQFRDSQKARLSGIH